MMKSALLRPSPMPFLRGQITHGSWRGIMRALQPASSMVFTIPSTPCARLPSDFVPASFSYKTVSLYPLIFQETSSGKIFPGLQLLRLAAYTAARRVHHEQAGNSEPDHQAVVLAWSAFPRHVGSKACRRRCAAAPHFFFFSTDHASHSSHRWRSRQALVRSSPPRVDRDLRREGCRGGDLATGPGIVRATGIMPLNRIFDRAKKTFSEAENPNCV